MRYKTTHIIFILTLSLLSCSYLEFDQELYSNPDLVPNEDCSGCVITKPPLELRLDTFYTKYCDAQGIPIVSSDKVEDMALKQAYYIINNMLLPIPDVHKVLVAEGYYVAIISCEEQQTTLPEYSNMDSEYWDKRARGLGGGRGNQITSCGEENLLCLGSGEDRFKGENILIHEFAHTIHLGGQGENYEEFNKRLFKIYCDAMNKDLWQDTYAATNHEEYWAEGVQSYYNCNIESQFGDGVHNYVNTREELAEYDPVLYNFISSNFDYFDWTPACPDQ
jgi:hypothetical protein